MYRIGRSTVAGVFLAAGIMLSGSCGAELKSTAPVKDAPIKKVKPPALPATPVDKAPANSCGNNGTAVHFVATPSMAARQALKEHKLVFVLHVSGLFEDPRVT